MGHGGHGAHERPNGSPTSSNDDAAAPDDRGDDDDGRGRHAGRTLPDRAGSQHDQETMPNAPIRPVRFNADEFLSIDQLPPPKKSQAKPEPEPERPKLAAIRQVGIADQIAI